MIALPTKAAQSGDLLDVVALDRCGVLVTGEGALVRVVAVTARNPRVMGDDERLRVSRGFAAMVGRLKAGQSLQFYVEGAPLLLGDVLRAGRDEVDRALGDQPPERAAALRRLAAGHEQSIVQHSCEQAAVDFRAYVVVPFLSGPSKVDWRQFVPGRRLSTAPLTRGLADHQRVVRESLVHTDNIIGDLEALGLASWLLDGPQVAELLYRRFNPTSATGVGYRPRLEVVGTLDERANAESAAEAARRLREQIAASPVDFDDPRVVGVEQCLERVHYVSAPPDVTQFGMLLGAMEIDSPFALSMHVHALDRRKERKRVRGTRVRLHGLNVGAQMRGRVPSLEMIAKEKESTQLLDELRGSQRQALWDVSVYQSVRQPGPLPDKGRLVEASGRAVEAMRDAGDADVKFGGFMQRELWQSTLPLGRDVARRTRRYVSRHVGDLVPLVGPNCGSHTGVPFFFADGVRTLLNFNPWAWELLNGLMVVNGQQGTGKTMLGVTTAARLLAYGVGVTIMDRSGHYEFLTRLVPGAAHLSIGGAGCAATINPWDVPDARRVPDEKIRFLLALHEVMLGGKVTDVDKNLLIEAIQAVYATCAREARQPLERDLKAELERLAAVVQEAAGGRLTKRAEDLATLATRLTRYVAPGPDSFLVDRPTTVPDDAPLIVFDTRLAGTHLAAAMFIALEHTVARVERHRQERVARPGPPLLFGGDAFISDETWKLLESRGTGQWVNDLARRSRHLGLFLMAISQYFTDFDNEFGRALLNSAHMKLFFQQSEEELRGMQATLGLSDNEVDQIARLQTSKGRYAKAYWVNARWGSGVVNVLLGGQEHWMATSEPGQDVPRREATLARHRALLPDASEHEVAWAALQELVEGGVQP